MPVPKLLNPDPRIGTVYVTADESASFPFIYLFTIFTMFLHSSNQLHFILHHLYFGDMYFPVTFPPKSIYHALKALCVEFALSQHPLDISSRRKMHPTL